MSNNRNTVEQTEVTHHDQNSSEDQRVGLRGVPLAKTAGQRVVRQPKPLSGSRALPAFLSGAAARTKKTAKPRQVPSAAKASDIVEWPKKGSKRRRDTAALEVAGHRKRQKEMPALDQVANDGSAVVKKTKKKNTLTAMERNSSQTRTLSKESFEAIRTKILRERGGHRKNREQHATPLVSHSGMMPDQGDGKGDASRGAGAAAMRGSTSRTAMAKSLDAILEEDEDDDVDVLFFGGSAGVRSQHQQQQLQQQQRHDVRTRLSVNAKYSNAPSRANEYMAKESAHSYSLSPSSHRSGGVSTEFKVAVPSDVGAATAASAASAGRDISRTMGKVVAKKRNNAAARVDLDEIRKNLMRLKKASKDAHAVSAGDASLRRMNDSGLGREEHSGAATAAPRKPATRTRAAKPVARLSSLFGDM